VRSRKNARRRRAEQSTKITHLLQGISRHSDTGVMKAHWSGADFCEMRRKPLGFTVEDVDLIYRGLSARPAGTGTLVAAR
jgi:hypothetical protein